jgi:alanyl-tRNA synthetase
MPSANDIRQQFLDFFKSKGHTIVPSAPVVPHDDPTLLFTNAGMNQFKDVFLGTGSRPYKRAADTQKCIRAGGKHNDLDDVGKDTYHHTFFEMLGNWSFGDYFKREAIQWAWELLTEVWKLDKSRLHATVFEGDPASGVARDDEAADLWRTVTDIDPAHIHWGNKKDNFWEMGETGPCGPCTEIHYDRTPDKSGGPLVNGGDARVIEIWNLVFIQFNCNADKTLTPLPAKHVDTGMGFERVTAVIQGKDSNYDTDVFEPIFGAIERVTGAATYGGKLDDLRDTAYRVIADHMRALAFALTDGATPSNVGRGYVLRSILRRAERYGWQQLGTKEPFLHRLVPTVVDLMGGAFPELTRDPQRVADVIHDEEKGFLRTLGRGMKLFAEAAERAKKAGGVVSGKDAFDLHTEQGVFIDITEQMAAESGLKVDRVHYRQMMDQFRRKSGEGRKQFTITALTGDLPATDDSQKYNPFPYIQGHGASTILGWVKDDTVIREGTLRGDETVAILLDRTCFYAEQGGQVGDCGFLRTSTGLFDVLDTQRLGNAVLHVGQLKEGAIEVGQSAGLRVDDKRWYTRKNHTATHLLNWALRRVLGDHVEQKGSLVDLEKTRFDFSHSDPLTSEQIARVEQLVNEQVQKDLPVRAYTMALAKAKQLPGVRAVFGEKYPDPVRVIVIGAQRPEAATPETSIEFCGGTHLDHTSQAGLFKIVSQELVSKGVRRVTAVTGPKAVETVEKMSSVLEDLSGKFHCRFEELPARIEALQEELKRLQQQAKKGAASDLAGAADKLLAAASAIGGAKLIVGEVPAAPVDAIRTQIDRLRQKAGSSVIALGWADDGKVGLLVAVTDDLVSKGLHAGKLVGEAAKAAGGKGGGKPTLAQAGGNDPAKLGEALALAARLAREQLTS